MVDVLGMCLYASPFVISFTPIRGARCHSKGYYIHIGVGFEVAYLSELGKFDGQKSEISDEHESHAFCICVEPSDSTYLKRRTERWTTTSTMTSNWLMAY